MKVFRMAKEDIWEKIDTYPIHKALRHIDIPLVIVFLGMEDNRTPDGIRREQEKTYLTIRLPYEQIKACKHGALDLMKFLLLSQIRHLKHLDWYNLYFDIKKALATVEQN